MVNFGGLPYMPLSEQWLFEHPAFVGGDARLVRACVRMLASAWRNAPAGSLAPSFASLSSVTGLTEAEISEHYETLTHGWELRDERLFHVGLSDLCERLAARHGEALMAVAEEAVAASQDPDSFELTAGAPVAHANKGKKILRDSWRPSPETIKELIARGIREAEDQEYVLKRMRLWAKSQAIKRADWDATLLTFADRMPHSELPSKRLSPALPFVSPAPGGRFSGLVNKSEAARANNFSVFDSIPVRSDRYTG